MSRQPTTVCSTVPLIAVSQDLPKQQLNAIVLLLVQLLRLVTFYLGVKLPFVIKGDNVRPLISPAQGLACLPEFVCYNSAVVMLG